MLACQVVAVPGTEGARGRHRRRILLAASPAYLGRSGAVDEHSGRTVLPSCQLPHLRCTVAETVEQLVSTWCCATGQRLSPTHQEVFPDRPKYSDSRPSPAWSSSTQRRMSSAGQAACCCRTDCRRYWSGGSACRRSPLNSFHRRAGGPTSDPIYQRSSGSLQTLGQPPVR